ncbi:MAG: DUF2235 domain-containing protein [Alphaproteobacteria bacterium]
MAKNIVILSDGTGNGAAKANKTNVWRLFQTLQKDLPDKQVVFYDDGVGADFNPRVAAIGGIFGFGLRKNVMQMYEFLCLNYEPGDNIYLFGFSRGAFTVRLLSGLIARRGIFDGTDRKNADHLSSWINDEYRQFRKIYDKAYLSKVITPIWHSAKSLVIRKEPLPDRLRRAPEDVSIKFLGVWDTVDAYGLPVDELADICNKFIFQMRFDDQDVSKVVQNASQALSIDDERLTFHPLVWNEPSPQDKQAQEISKAEAGISQPRFPKINQVWFAGVHTDCGGGYHEPELALVSLNWMLNEAKAASNGSGGLQFLPEPIARYKEQANPHGKIHNSRAALAALYRYKPRYIDELCNDGIVKTERIASITVF